MNQNWCEKKEKLNRFTVNLDWGLYMSGVIKPKVTIYGEVVCKFLILSEMLGMKKMYISHTAL